MNEYIINLENNNGAMFEIRDRNNYLMGCIHIQEGKIVCRGEYYVKKYVRKKDNRAEKKTF